MTNDRRSPVMTRLATRAGAAPLAPAREQRLHREPDPRVRRSVAVALLGATLLVAIGLGVVALRVHQVHLAYRLDALRAERTRMERLIQQLRVEVASLKAPGRVESRARQLGLVAPSREQVHLAREYVRATGSRAAAAAGPTTAARAGGAEALVR